VRCDSGQPGLVEILTVVPMVLEEVQAWMV
jgi:hypothetical protein